ncbi:hypothetical protein RYX36_033862 [Vicia faba]
MEGLLPLIFRVIRKTKSRRKYKCLSSGAALRHNEFQGYHEDPGYCSRVDDDHYAEKIIDFRRYNSISEFTSSPMQMNRSGVDSNEYMSHRKEFVPCSRGVS